MTKRPRKKAAPAPAPAAEKPGYHSRSVTKALEVIEVLKRSSKPMGLHRLSEEVGLTKASLLRVLDTLKAGGYLHKNSGGEYSLSSDLGFMLPVGWLSGLLRAALPQLKQLTQQFRESTALAHLYANHIEVIGVCECQQTVRMGNSVGRILQPHASSLGKVISAFQEEERQERLVHCYGLLPMTAKTITEESRLKEEFARIREQGYGVDDEETTPGGRCFGAPIRAPWGQVIAAVSISVPMIRLGSPERGKALVTALKATAAAISSELTTGQAGRKTALASGKDV